MSSFTCEEGGSAVGSLGYVRFCLKIHDILYSLYYVVTLRNVGLILVLSHGFTRVEWGDPNPEKEIVETLVYAIMPHESHLPYDASMLFWKAVTHIFFREIRPRGAFNIPKDGPVIFVGAPHHNQVIAPSTARPVCR